MKTKKKKPDPSVYPIELLAKRAGEKSDKKKKEEEAEIELIREPPAGD